MDEHIKKKHLGKATEHLKKVQERILVEIDKTETGIKTKMSFASAEDKQTNASVKAMREDRLSQLEIMKSSPYFNKSVCIFDGKEKEYYFGKFTLTEAGIYSWVVPAAIMRFEDLGNISYTLPDGRIRKGELIGKDQYMITDGKILFYTKETKNTERQLIHQEHFSTRKDGFVLPEIVSVMEKAQDMIIRAHHRGPFAISGPAGSGKTTLALHRAAYLIQSPDTADLYPSEKVIVFVQDTGTKEYFSSLLPELGINHVEITTYFEWAKKILPLEDVELVSEFFPTDGVPQQSYVYEKIKTLRSKEIPKWNMNVFNILEKYFGKSFANQKKSRVLDRIDVTVLLQSYLNAKNKFETVRRFTRATHQGTLVKKSEKKILKYSLMIIDEFQNYMPEQIRLLTSCLNEETRAMIYVGDMAQQVRLGTIRSWKDIGEDVPEGRNVILHKVYRNTKQILNYINSLGYSVEIPEGIKDGPEVIEHHLSKEKILACVKEQMDKKRAGETLGIIGKRKEDVDFLREQINEEGVHVCTMIESQGVEFDRVCLIIPKEVKVHEDVSREFQEEIAKIEKDLLYVALTRAIREMTVVWYE